MSKIGSSSHVSFSNGTLGQLLGQYWGHFLNQKEPIEWPPRGKVWPKPKVEKEMFGRFSLLEPARFEFLLTGQAAKCGILQAAVSRYYRLILILYLLWYYGIIIMLLQEDFSRPQKGRRSARVEQEDEGGERALPRRPREGRRRHEQPEVVRSSIDSGKCHLRVNIHQSSNITIGLPTNSNLYGTLQPNLLQWCQFYRDFLEGCDEHVCKISGE